MTSSMLILASAVIVGVLGIAHLVITYYGPKLVPRDPVVVEAMQKTPLRITDQTTVWRAWIGFNASHSLGAILFSLIYGYLALEQPTLLFDSSFLQSLGLLILVSYVLLAYRYWFSKPLAGTSLALACYIAALALS